MGRAARQKWDRRFQDLEHCRAHKIVRLHYPLGITTKTELERFWKMRQSLLRRHGLHFVQPELKAVFPMPGMPVEVGRIEAVRLTTTDEVEFIGKRI